MDLEVTIEGRTRQVRVVARREGGYRIVLDDGPALDVQAQRLGYGEWAIQHDDCRTLVGATARGDHIALQLHGRGLTGRAVDARTAALQLGAGAGEGIVCTQMPGVVVRLLVESGQAVDEGEPVIVVEAMKMENELKAPISGTIAEIHVEAGQAVESGAPLLLISP